MTEVQRFGRLFTIPIIILYASESIKTPDCDPNPQ